MHLELITAQTTAAGTGGAAAVPAVGDSLTVKNSKSQATIVAVWNQNRSDGFVQLIKPSGHDTTRGWRGVVDPNNIMNLFAPGMGLKVQPQELISATIAGSAFAGEVESVMLQMHYEDLPGVNARLIDWPELMKRADLGKLNTIQVSMTGTAAGYTGEELITADSNLLMANRDYAVLGIVCNVPCAAVYLVGPDSASQRVAVPGGVSEADVGRDYFCSLARAFGMPLIPVINSGNRANTRVGFVQNEVNITVEASILLALLD